MSVKSGFPTSLGSPREAQLPVSGISNKHLQGLPGAFLTPKRLTKRCENATVRSQVAGAEPEHHHHRVLIIMMFMPVLCHVRVLHLQSHSLSLFASLRLSCLDEKWMACVPSPRERMSRQRIDHPSALFSSLPVRLIVTPCVFKSVSGGGGFIQS